VVESASRTKRSRVDECRLRVSLRVRRSERIMTRTGWSRTGKTALTRTTYIRIRISNNRSQMSSSNTSTPGQFSNTRGCLFYSPLPFSVSFHHFTAFFSTRASSNHSYRCSHSPKGLWAGAKTFSSYLATSRHQNWLAVTYIDTFFADLHVSVHLPFIHPFVHSMRSFVSSSVVFHLLPIQEDP
jgi:hypothetical protein